MRVELLDAGKTLSPTAYSHAFGLHAVTMLGLFVAAFAVIPTLVVRPGRGAVTLGGLAFVGWAVAMACFTIAALTPAPWITGSEAGPGLLRGAIVALAIAVGLAAAQLAVSLPANADGESRWSAIAAIGAIIALAIVGLPLATGELPTRFHLLIASTVVACTIVPAVIGGGADSLIWLAIAPCLVMAWIATAFLRGASVDLPLHDTVAVVAPFPAMGGAVLAALVLAAARGRAVRPQLARTAAVLIAGGTIATSVGFLLLGTRGLPRRYQQYFDAVQLPQIVVGVAAVVTLVGAIAALRSARASG